MNVLAQLYQKYIDLVYAVCIKYSRDTDESKDAGMDIVESLGEMVRRHEMSKFRSWLYTVVKNHCLVVLRSAGKEKSVELNEAVMQSADELHHEVTDEKEWQLNQMEKCIETLAA